MTCGFPSANQFLEAIDSDEWTEYLAFWELENIPDQSPPPPKDPEVVCRELDRIMGINPRGNNNRKAQHGQHAGQ